MWQLLYNKSFLIYYISNKIFSNNLSMDSIFLYIFFSWTPAVQNLSNHGCV